MKRLNGGEFLIDLSNGIIDDGALLGVNNEFLSLYPLVGENLKKNRIYVKMNEIIIPCVYTISGLILTISGVFNNGNNGLVLLTIACEYDVDEFDIISIVGITIASEEKTDVLDSQSDLLLENIVDADGNKRFVEGDGTPLQLTGVTISYCKWSLSGTHLMFVVAGTIDNNVTITNGTIFATYEIPKWVHDKVFPVWSNSIELKSIQFVNDDWTAQSGSVSLSKTTSNRIRIQKTGDLVTTAIRNFRIAFDLLIDNE